jgi:hypothetical protein
MVYKLGFLLHTEHWRPSCSNTVYMYYALDPVSERPELRVFKPRALEVQRAKCTSEAVVSNYFNELENILDKYNLKTKPHLIYNVDEKGISQIHTPPHIVGSVDNHPQAVTAGKSPTTTIIGCGGSVRW